jgi:hypothetical protein
MSRTATDGPTLMQCKESCVALIDGEELYARTGEIFKADHRLVRHWPACFTELGDMADSPRFIPHVQS